MSDSVQTDERTAVDEAQLPSDLPAVEPPTAGFIVQLFLIPAMIVAVVVTVYLLFGKIAGGHRSPDEYLADLRGANEERRWLAAHELALVLRNDKTWQDNERFAADLAALLDAELASSTRDEQATQYQQYLASALGAFNSSAGIETLRKALQPSVAAEVRFAAIWSLARLSERLDRSKLAPAVPDLVVAGGDEDPGIRKLAAYAMGAIGEPDAVSGLTPLLYDPDREVCYNAASAVARLGSTASLNRLQEMLNFDYLKQSLSGSEKAADADAQVEAIAYSSLESLSELLDKTPDADLEPLRPDIERAAAQGTALVQTSAKSLLIKMSR